MTENSTQTFAQLTNNKLYVEISVEPALLKRALHLYDEVKSYETSGTLETPFMFMRANWNSDLMWISTNSAEVFHKAKTELFDSIDISGITSSIHVENEVRCFNCFFLRRSTCHGYNWHKDFSFTNYQGFTVIIPLLAMEKETRGHLAYREEGKTKLYTYTFGRGIIFSDGFVHSPHPFVGVVPALFLCFTFGSDKVEYWPAILDCLHTQSQHICRYDGEFVGCKAEYQRIHAQTNP